MNIPFLEKWRRRHPAQQDRALAAAFEDDPDGVAELLSECELLRSQAAAAGLELDDSPASLAALDQLLPLWRDSPAPLQAGPPLVPWPFIGWWPAVLLLTPAGAPAGRPSAVDRW